ncbi:hypothetical protein ACTXT7_002160 [Hymenolepis weldensis]
MQFLWTNPALQLLVLHGPQSPKKESKASPPGCPLLDHGLFKITSPNDVTPAENPRISTK